MHWIIPIVLASAPLQGPVQPPVNDPTPTDESSLSGEVDDCQRGVKSLKNDVLGLEFYLQDKKDYKIYCPYTKWEQPKLEEYKKEPKSYLPKDCKIEKI
jgi:hypothetical protein